MMAAFDGENRTPNCDPMAMLMAAHKETATENDEKVAVQTAMKISEEQRLEEEHLQAVLRAQSEEDSAAVEAAAREEEDMRLAMEAHAAEEKAAKEAEEQRISQMSEDEKLAHRMQEELADEFYQAVSKGDVAKATQMLKQAMDPNAIASKAVSRESALMCAVKKKNMAVIEALIKAEGINLNHQDASGFTALHRAAESNRCDILLALLKAGAKPDPRSVLGHTPLMTAAKNGHGDPITFLIKHGADLYAKDNNNKLALNLVPMFSTTLKERLQGMMGWGLLEACRKGKGDEVMHLVERGASVFLSDSKNMTGLHFAAAGGHNMICEYLCSKKANPNALDTKGETCLFKAAQAGSGSVWTTLIKHGADPTIKCPKGSIAADHCNASLPLSKIIRAGNLKLSPSKGSPPKKSASPSAA